MDTPVMGYVTDGKLRVVAVTSAARSAVLPNVPAVAESVAGYEAGGWYGIWAPRNAPGDIVERLNAEIRGAG